MTVAQDIETKLTESFQPASLEVIDESSQHAGHMGARPEGETHFRVERSSPMRLPAKIVSTDNVWFTRS